MDQKYLEKKKITESSRKETLNLPHTSKYFKKHLHCIWGFPGGSDGKESACNTGDLGSIPGLGRSSGEGNGYPLQYTGLKNPVDRAWQATVHAARKSWARLSD